MAAEAAQRSGAGLVSVITRSAHRPAFLGKFPEIMMFGTEDEDAPVDELLARASVIVIGPGLGRSEWSRTLLQLALSKQVSAGIPLVVDADGLNLLSERSDSKVVIKRDNWILTPHAGEAARLLGSTVADVQADRFAAVTELYNRWGGCCLLKGSGSLIAAPNEELFLCTEGNAGMASGGMGDVLSGVIAGLVAQKLTLPQSLCCAVCIHGEAADLAMEAGGQRGMIATDLSRHIRQLVNPTH
jgi:NAD(P)H-hydrate epimerase